MTDYEEIVEELIKEDFAIIKELIEEEIVPLLKHQKEQEDEAFEKAYQEVKDLEEL